MATRDTPSKHQLNNTITTLDASSITSSVVEEKFLGQAAEGGDADDGPVVFICGKCKLPVGDSTSWDGSEDGLNQIRLKRVTDNVLMGKENRLYEVSKRSVCLILDLFCRSCKSVIGMVYTSTPKNLDHKRSTFCLNVADIDSYVLGSGRQKLSAEGPKEQPVTLEYRGVVQQQLTEMKMLVRSMGLRLQEIEVGLQERATLSTMAGNRLHAAQHALPHPQGFISRTEQQQLETANQHAVSKGYLDSEDQALDLGVWTVEPSSEASPGTTKGGSDSKQGNDGGS